MLRIIETESKVYCRGAKALCPIPTKKTQIPNNKETPSPYSGMRRLPIYLRPAMLIRLLVWWDQGPGYSLPFLLFPGVSLDLQVPVLHL